MKTLIFLLIISLAIAVDDFSSAQYQALSAKEKMNSLWAKITENQSELGFYSALTTSTIFFESMPVTFNHQADDIPSNRKKLIHTVGAIAQAQFVVDPANRYSGIFEGADNVLIRLSTAKEADMTKTTADGAFDNFTPGMSLKFLRDGVPSANLLAMYGVNGFPSWNFFFKEFSNHIPAGTGAALSALSCKFTGATKYIQTIGLKDLASWTQRGIDRRNGMSFPFQLVFRPTAQVNTLFPNEFTAKYTQQMKTIKTGTVIYDVYAIQSPNATGVKIGSLRTTSPFVTSHWGDEKLWFQHNLMDDDLAVHPEWTANTPTYSCL